MTFLLLLITDIECLNRGYENSQGLDRYDSCLRFPTYKYWFCSAELGIQFEEKVLFR